MATLKNLVLLALLVSFSAHAVVIDNLRLDTNTISTLDTNGNLVVSPNGTGKLRYTPGTATTVPYIDANKDLVSSSVTPTELGYLTGVTSAIQTQIDLKAPLASPTFTGTITTPLTASRAVATDGSSALAASATTATELGYLSGVTSAVQTQFSGKANTTLNNLGSVAFNSDLLPSADNARSIGSISLGIANIYATSLQAMNVGSNQPTAILTGENAITSPSATSIGASLRAVYSTFNGVSGRHLSIETGSNANSNDDDTGSIFIETGNKSQGASTGDTGGISLRTGVPAGSGARGKIKFLDGSEGTVGHVWTSTSTDGIGEWAEAGGAGGGSAGINILTGSNPQGESSTSDWNESGGGTLASETTAANVANGEASLSFDASADTDYAYSTLKDIPAGLYGANCLLEFYYKGFDANITAQVHDGTNLVAELDLTAASTYTKAQINFICPSSGQLQMRLLAGADAAIGYWDEVHLGSASNIANVSQAAFVGSARYATTANCVWSRTSTTLGAFGTDTDCPAPTVLLNQGPGALQAVDADLPQFTVNNLPPGTYRVHFYGAGFQNSTSSANTQSLAISDGTTTVAESSSLGASANNPVLNIEGVFTYTTAGNRTFSLFGAASANSIQISNATVNFGLSFEIYRYPSSTDQALTAATSAMSWSGYHDATCSWARTNTAYGDPTADASCALVQRTNTNFGTVTGTNDLPELNFTPGKIGKYYVCAHVGLMGATNGADLGLKLWDGTTTIAEASHDVEETGGQKTVPICGIYSATSLAAKTLSLQTKSSTGAVTIQPRTAGDTAIEWSIFAIDQQMPAPLLVNSVVNKSAGVTGVEYGYINCDSGATILNNPGSWIASVSNVSAGSCTLTLNAGVFSTAPACFANVITDDGAGDPWITAVKAATTTTSVLVDTSGNSAGDASAVDFYVFCIGAR